MAEDSDFKLGTQHGFAKAHHTPKKKWTWSYAIGAPNIFRFPFNICATAEASNFKFGMQLGFAKTHHKNTTKGKRGRGLGLGKLLNIWRAL